MAKPKKSNNNAQAKGNKNTAFPGGADSSPPPSLSPLPLTTSAKAGPAVKPQATNGKASTSPKNGLKKSNAKMENNKKSEATPSEPSSSKGNAPSNSPDVSRSPSTNTPYSAPTFKKGKADLVRDAWRSFYATVYTPAERAFNLNPVGYTGSADEPDAAFRQRVQREWAHYLGNAGLADSEPAWADDLTPTEQAVVYEALLGVIVDEQEIERVASVMSSQNSQSVPLPPQESYATINPAAFKMEQEEESNLDNDFAFFEHFSDGAMSPDSLSSHPSLSNWWQSPRVSSQGHSPSLSMNSLSTSPNTSPASKPAMVVGQDELPGAFPALWAPGAQAPATTTNHATGPVSKLSGWLSSFGSRSDTKPDMQPPAAMTAAVLPSASSADLPSSFNAPVNDGNVWAKSSKDDPAADAWKALPRSHEEHASAGDFWKPTTLPSLREASPEQLDWTALAILKSETDDESAKTADKVNGKRKKRDRGLSTATTQPVKSEPISPAMHTVGSASMERPRGGWKAATPAPSTGVHPPAASVPVTPTDSRDVDWSSVWQSLENEKNGGPAPNHAESWRSHPTGSQRSQSVDSQDYWTHQSTHEWDEHEPQTPIVNAGRSRQQPLSNNEAFLAPLRLPPAHAAPQPTIPGGWHQHQQLPMSTPSSSASAFATPALPSLSRPSSSGTSTPAEYVGPVLEADMLEAIAHARDEDRQDLEAKFAQYKIDTRIRLIHSFHAEAAKAEEELVRRLYAISITQGSTRAGKQDVKRQVSDHYERMRKLQGDKEDERRRTVDAERQRRLKECEEREQERQRIFEEKRRQAELEHQRMLEEQRRLAEEQRRRQLEEQRRLAEEQRQRQIEEQKRIAEEKKRIAEEQRRRAEEERERVERERKAKEERAAELVRKEKELQERERQVREREAELKRIEQDQIRRVMEREAEEQQRRRAEEEAIVQRRRQEELARTRAAEDRRKAEERRREEERKREEENLPRRREEEQRRLQEEMHRREGEVRAKKAQEKDGLLLALTTTTPTPSAMTSPSNSYSSNGSNNSNSSTNNAQHVYAANPPVPHAMVSATTPYAPSNTPVNDATLRPVDRKVWKPAGTDSKPTRGALPSFEWQKQVPPPPKMTRDVPHVRTHIPASNGALVPASAHPVPGGHAISHGHVPPSSQHASLSVPKISHKTPSASASAQSHTIWIPKPEEPVAPKVSNTNATRRARTLSDPTPPSPRLGAAKALPAASSSSKPTPPTISSSATSSKVPTVSSTKASAKAPPPVKPTAAKPADNKKPAPALEPKSKLIVESKTARSPTPSTISQTKAAPESAAVSVEPAKAKAASTGTSPVIPVNVPSTVKTTPAPTPAKPTTSAPSPAVKHKVTVEEEPENENADVGGALDSDSAALMVSNVAGLDDDGPSLVEVGKTLLDKGKDAETKASPPSKVKPASQPSSGKATPTTQPAGRTTPAASPTISGKVPQTTSKVASSASTSASDGHARWTPPVLGKEPSKGVKR
ncbi:hypothetical protein CYLTODRAFT_44939 [Cylindrobasidium torrendii FP15055 ss-10]|uniref:Stress response protein NST1 n=1 Tax=Cylindrobasidium torrendii FP15055 ss-10 TaxID=1314674 RepID=A0A0D7B728_9AGAR|nr:hypothetical protein CYLTODRAFT_44939 [Cylindrobasidium torrendii FP15055 ss-10]